MDKSKEYEELNRKVHAVRGECFHIPDGNNVDECKKCGYAFQRDNFEPYDCREDNKDYPGNIAQAWELVGDLSTKYPNIRIIRSLRDEYHVSVNVNNKWIFGVSKSAPTAICLAYIEVNKKEME